MSGRDEAAECWLTFYDAHQPALWAYALALTGSSHDAADLLHDVLLSMLRKRPRADHALAMSSVPCATGQSMPTGARSAPSGFSPAPRPASNPRLPATLPQTPHARSPAQWLSLLSPDQAEIVILRLRAGLDFEAIARIVSRPAGTVTACTAAPSRACAPWRTAATLPRRPAMTPHDLEPGSIEARIAGAPAPPPPPDLRARLEASLRAGPSRARLARRAALVLALALLALAGFIVLRRAGTPAEKPAPAVQQFDPVVVSFRVEALWGPPAAERVDVRRWASR
jgi:hypothetical protein